MAIRDYLPFRGKRFRNVDTVFFDVGGTLVFSRWDPMGLLRRAMQEVGLKVSRDKLLAANETARRAVARRRRRHAGSIPVDRATEMWWDHLATELGTGVEGAALEAAVTPAAAGLKARASTEVDPAAMDVLQYLREKRYDLGVVSNWSTDLPEYLDAHGLSRFFDAVIASEAVGSAKPHREIFLRALSVTGATAGRSVHVGDDYWADVVGARELGIRPVLIDRFGDSSRDDCVTLRDLAGLRKLL